MLLAIGMAVGALTMQTLDGREITMSNYPDRRGTLIIFVSSRSPAVQAAIEPLLRIHEKYRRKEVLFVGLCANDEETGDELKAFCQRNDINFPVYRDRDRAIAKRFGARVTPEPFLLDEKGVLRYRGGFQGPEAVEDIDSAIRHFLAGEPLPRESFPAAGTPIEDIGSKGPDQDPSEPLAFSSEVIFEKIPWTADHHCSTIDEAPNGDLLCVWYGGSYECADDQVLFLARRNKGEGAWSRPEVLTSGAFLHPPGNAVVFRASPTRMMVLFDRMDEPRPIRNGRWGKGQLVAKDSDDNGHTWSADEEVHLGVGGIRNAPFTLETGELMIPMSNPKPCFMVTRDGGATWEVSGAMDKGGQPTAVQRSDGSLLCFLRNNMFILRSESHDLGKTWTPTEPSTLRCPGAGMAMVRLRNGHLVLVFNDSSVERTPLSVALSTDDGTTWRRPVSLEANPGEYAYPCVIETSDGHIHVTYTFLRLVIKHAEFNERWLTLLSPPDRSAGH
jgi:predicted neuraminidase/peroxiredoxin